MIAFERERESNLPDWLCEKKVRKGQTHKCTELHNDYVNGGKSQLRKKLPVGEE